MRTVSTCFHTGLSRHNRLALQLLMHARWLRTICCSGCILTKLMWETFVYSMKRILPSTVSLISSTGIFWDGKCPCSCIPYHPVMSWLRLSFLQKNWLGHFWTKQFAFSPYLDILHVFVAVQNASEDNGNPSWFMKDYVRLHQRHKSFIAPIILLMIVSLTLIIASI